MIVFNLMCLAFAARAGDKLGIILAIILGAGWTSVRCKIKSNAKNP